MPHTNPEEARAYWRQWHRDHRTRTEHARHERNALVYRTEDGQLMVDFREFKLGQLTQVVSRYATAGDPAVVLQLILEWLDGFNTRAPKVADNASNEA